MVNRRNELYRTIKVAYEDILAEKPTATVKDYITMFVSSYYNYTLDPDNISFQVLRCLSRNTKGEAVFIDPTAYVTHDIDKETISTITVLLLNKIILEQKEYIKGTYARLLFEFLSKDAIQTVGSNRRFYIVYETYIEYLLIMLTNAIYPSIINHCKEFTDYGNGVWVPVTILTEATHDQGLEFRFIIMDISTYYNYPIVNYDELGNKSPLPTSLEELTKNLLNSKV